MINIIYHFEASEESLHVDHDSLIKWSKKKIGSLWIEFIPILKLSMTKFIIQFTQYMIISANT